MRCPHYPACGGCSSQEVPYLDQLQQKQAFIEKLFNTPVLPIIGCLDPWRYRNKMEFSFSQNKAKDKFLGLILRSSRGKVLNLQECHIAPTWFASAVQSVKKWWDANDIEAYHFHKGAGSLRTLTLREGKKTGEKMAMLTVSGDPRYAIRKSHIASLQEAIGDPQISLFLRIQQCIKGQPTQFYEMHLQGKSHICEELAIQGRALRFLISPTSFFQPNTAQAEILYNEALALAQPSSSDHVFDLYAGTSTIGLAFAPHVRKVTAIEINPHAVFDAKANAEINGIANFEALCGDVGKLLEGLKTPDLAIVDPPRSGLEEGALNHLNRLLPPRILYISCNAEKQALNIARMPQYRPIAIRPVDQFPHTGHIENIVLLERQ